MQKINYKYSLRYNIELENDESGYYKEEAENKGLTDCFLGISIIIPEDGTYSQCVVVDINAKEKRPMTQDEIFKAWMALGMSLKKEEGLTGWHKDFIDMYSTIVYELFEKNNISN